MRVFSLFFTIQPRGLTFLLHRHQTGSQVVLVQCFVLSTTQRPYFFVNFWLSPDDPTYFVFFSHWMPKIMLSPNDPSFFEPVLSPNAPACWRAGLTPVFTSYLTAPPPPRAIETKYLAKGHKHLGNSGALNSLSSDPEVLHCSTGPHAVSLCSCLILHYTDARTSEIQWVISQVIGQNVWTYS